MSIALVTTAGVSFRAVSKIIIHLNLYLHLNLQIPAHTSVLNWIKKQGISQFMDKSYFSQEKWVLIFDESIQFGNKKLLLVLAVPESRCRQGKALSYKDMKPLVLKSGSSWKSEDIKNEITQCIDVEHIACCISDSGGNLTGAINLLGSKHISDINHKITLIVESVYKNNPLLDQYTKALSLLRAQKSMSKNARIVPPNQRIMNRFMNLTPLFQWGVKMISLMEQDQLTEEENSTVSFLKPMKEFIFDTCHLLICLKKIQKMLKNNGFNRKKSIMAKKLLSDIKSDNSLKIRKQIDEYFADLLKKSNGETICCSSDIIESCFGRYKELVKKNKCTGITDLSFCIAAILGNNNSQTIKQAMETVSMKKVKQWKTENICKTLFAEKIELNKKIDRNYF